MSSPPRQTKAFALNTRLESAVLLGLVTRDDCRRQVGDVMSVFVNSLWQTAVRLLKLFGFISILNTYCIYHGTMHFHIGIRFIPIAMQ